MVITGSIPARREGSLARTQPLRHQTAVAGRIEVSEQNRQCFAHYPAAIDTDPV
jgi:hypothetical protein